MCSTVVNKNFIQLVFSVIGIVLSGIILIIQHFYHIGFAFYLAAQALIVLLLLFLLNINYRRVIYIYVLSCW